MDLIQLFKITMKLPEPWLIDNIQFDSSTNKIDVQLKYNDNLIPCTCCSQSLPVEKYTSESWRYLNFMHYETYITAELPHVICSSCHTSFSAVRPLGCSDTGLMLNP